MGIVFMIASCGSDSNGGDGDDDTTGDTGKFLSALEQDGFTVEEGELKYVDVFELCSTGEISHCFGNNANNPYLVYLLPPVPGEVLPDATNCVGSFQLREDEAVVLVGKTPPEMSYFSYRSYLYKRYYEEDQDYRLIFASLGDSSNLLTINSSGTPNGESGNPYNSDTIIITTADRGIDQRIRSAAESAGYPSSIMNTDVIPSELVRMGIGEKKDVFSFLNRLAQFKNEQECNEYVNNPPVRVFRVRPTTQAQLDPFSTPELRTRGNGVTEMDLWEALEDLREAILAKYSDLNATDLGINTPIPEGYEAIQNGTNALGDNRDTTYIATDPFLLPNNRDEFVIAYGLNHTETGKATYSNVTIYGTKYLNGVGGSDNRYFPGSAEYYIPGHEKAKYLYAWKMARHADGHPYCYEVPYDVSCYGVGLLEKAVVAFRSYLETETKVGPAYVELLYDRAIKFSPREID